MFIINCFFFILGLDLISIAVSETILNTNQIHHNCRWFFIHFFVNLSVVLNNYNDLKYCIINPEKCTLEKADLRAYIATELVMVAHFYHMIFFYKFLKKDDWIHHIGMCVFNGFVFYYQGLKIQSVTAFFCSGFPGVIDYFLLYFVKVKLLEPKIEKDVYLFLSTYFRSPGCLLCTYLSIPYFIRDQNNFDFILSFLSIFSVFVNGQYYMARTCIDYGKKY